MNTVSKPNKIRDWGDIAVTAISLLLGLFFLYHSFSIDESLSGDGVGPRLVPQIIATLLIVFSVGLLTTSLRGQSEQPPHHSASEALEDVADEIQHANEAESGFDEEQQPAEDTSLSVRLLPLQILVISLLYVAMFQWFGYLMATLLCAVPIYASFGNRNRVSLLVVPLVAIGIFYSLFFGVMGLFDLPGTLVDTTQFFRW